MIRRRGIPRRGLLVAGLAAPFIPPAQPESAVRFGSAGGLTDANLYLAEDQGYCAAAGISMKMQRMPNAPALRRYEATRKPRTSQIQALSRANDMNRFTAANEMVYGYDASTAPLAGVA